MSFERHIRPQEWDAFVESHQRAKLYHCWRWTDFLGRVFAFRVHRMVERDASGRLTGILPLVEQRSVVFGRRLVSLPYVNYGGPLGLTPAIEDTLLRQAADLARVARANVLEIRDDIAHPGVAARTDKASIELELPENTEELAQLLGAKLRSQVRRADRESPQASIGGAELLGDFYPVFASAMHDLGTPVYPRRFFEELLGPLAMDCTVVAVRLRGRPAAAALLTHFRDRTEIPWAASLRELRATSVNMRLYWECLIHAIARGSRVFDFGRSTIDSGTYQFKLQWGGRPRQLYWHYPLAAGDFAVPGRGRLTEGAKWLWSRLPLGVANRVGPLISPGLPW